ncbi:hypothetical protein [Thalassospira lohafexi]|uniref:Uncharacterized protein n=1 Tax=Thalassospira lohafexi TaxID=744227 RepID=A0A2N3L0K6_9PROT|nr:hypothetical protein [Thalassospira lohafexi]PKR56344.1 hypothetical protein COO92_21300 [Thalassospira lohafexi]
MDFDQVWRLVAPAAELADEGVTKQEVREGLQNGSFMCFWKPGAAAITTSSRGNRLRVALAGGELAALEKINKDIIRYAKETGYRGVEIVGRPGWERALSNYEKVAVILRQDFKS